jgi:hypothetical protein
MSEDLSSHRRIGGILTLMSGSFFFIEGLSQIFGYFFDILIHSVDLELFDTIIYITGSFVFFLVGIFLLIIAIRVLSMKSVSNTFLLLIAAIGICSSSLFVGGNLWIAISYSMLKIYSLSLLIGICLLLQCGTLLVGVYLLYPKKWVGRTVRYYPINNPDRDLLKVQAVHVLDGSHHYVSISAYFPNPDQPPRFPPGTITQFPLMNDRAMAEGKLDLTHYRADPTALHIRVQGYRYTIANPRSGPPNTATGIELFGTTLPKTHPMWDAQATQNIGYSESPYETPELVIQIYLLSDSR